MSRDDMAIALELAEETKRARAWDKQRIGRPVRIGGDDGDLETRRMVPCRDCGTMLPISHFACRLAMQFSEILMARGEHPLDDGELLRCRPCAVKWRALERRRADELDRNASERVSRARAEGKLGEHDARWLEHHGYHESLRSVREYLARPKTQRRSRAVEEAL